jgi:LPS O-antigen subunit length determinant protein (WzzB/FepE family)
MDQNNQYNNPDTIEEEEGLDIMALVKNLWAGRKTILICTGIFIVLGLVAALTMKRTYSVSTTMVPQMTSSRSSSLASLASLAGMDLGMTQTAELSPLVYPQIVESVPYRVELMHAPLHWEKADTSVSLLTYTKDYMKPGVMATVKKYTIGLPFLLLSKMSKPKEVELPAGWEPGTGSSEPRPYTVTKDEEKMLKYLAQAVTLAVDKKEGYLTLTVNGMEPVQTADLAIKAQELLQSEVTRFRTEKAEDELKYIQERYDEIKKEAESYQASLAVLTDRSQNMTTSRARLERERLMAKYSVASGVYSEMAKQLEAAKMKVKKDTPVLTVVQPVTVPTKPANSRAKTLIVWTFLGIVLGCGIVLGKEYWPKVKEMLN